MGRRNKKLAKLQQSKQAREFLQHKEKAVSFLRLTPEEKRVEIAHTCVIILSNPELQYCKLESILELCNDYDEHIQSLAISSLCAVFIDILPGYRIQDHEEEGIVLSKEVKAVRIFETSLLKYYESYLSILMGKYNFGSVQCICRLLEKLLHFNYREKLADYAINAICELPDVVVPAIRVALLSNELELRYHVVKAIEKFVKTSSYKIVPSKIIEMLAEINFSMIQVEDLPQKRQRDHEDNEKKKEVQMNQKTLREVLAIYFIILKRSYNSTLMIPTLKGLSKHCLMLNVEIVLDLVKNLLALLKEDKVRGENKFHCMYSCIKIISTTQHALNFEDKDFTQILYNSLLTPPLEKHSQKMLIDSLIWMLIQQKQYSYELIAAFLKRILIVAVRSDSGLMKALLCLGKQVLCKFPKAYLLLEADDDTDSYLANMKDPYLAQAASSSILSELKAFKAINDVQVQRLTKSYFVKNPFDKKPGDFLI